MYNFDEIIDRANDEYSYSSKWASDGFAKACFGNKDLPKNRICLHVADMDFRCAPAIIEGIKKVVNTSIFGYSAPKKSYYEAIINWYRDRYNLDIGKAKIFHSHGTHEAIKEAIFRLTHENDYVIVLTPSYSYHRDIEGINRSMLAVKMINDNGNYRIDYEAFANACLKSKVFVLCNPHNPTGKIFSDDELIKLAAICRRNGVTIISDEVHGDIVRCDKCFKPLVKVVGSAGIITCNGINKTFNLAGLASSYFFFEDNKYDNYYHNYFSSLSPFEIIATISAYNDSKEWVNELNKYLDLEIEEVVNFIHQYLPKAKVVKPEGTYILWVDFRGYGLSDAIIHQKIYDNAHVVAQSGDHFDEEDKEQFQRFCIASPKKMVLEAFRRISDEFKNC